MRRLLDVLRDDRSETTLDIAALELATIEFPGLDMEAALFRLDNLADQLRGQVPQNATGLQFISACNELLFGVFQFRGNEGEYYDPRNSCLNSVLVRRLGIPITLSVVYIEIARRLQKPVFGIGLPGHFVVAYQDDESRYFIDPFHAGRILSLQELAELAKEAGGVDLRQNPAFLAPVTNRQILVRMLSNLKMIYLRGEAFDKARQVLDLLIEATPGSAEEYRQRAMIHLRLQNLRAAKSDLETYLRLEPNAPEREQVEQQLIQIERWKAGMN